METVKKKRAGGKGIGALKSLKINNYNCYYGTVQKNECKCVFFNVSSWILPTNDYKINIKRFEDRFSRHINKYIKHVFPLFKTFNIYNLEGSDKNATNSTRYNMLNENFSFLGLEVSLVFSNPIQYKEHVKEYELIINEMINYIENYEDLIFNQKNYK